jgi:murein DD-endopeptidase MepM/ murein hydrolase activator NlpD
MTGDRWTFLVVRDEDTPVRQYSVATRTFRVLGGFGVLFSLMLAVFGISAALDATARIQNRRLEARNEALTAELEQFRDRVGKLETTLGGLADKDALLRTMAGLEAIDPEVMEVGVGGPGLGAPESYPLWGVDSTASKDAYALSYDLNALERRARLLSSSLDEATDSMEAHRDLMESTPSILPTVGSLSSSFSKSRMHPLHNRPLPHAGVDISAPKGTPIFAAAKGRVVEAGWSSGYGLTVLVDHGYGYTTLYGHCSKILVQPGQAVKRGDVLGQVGATGIATSAHLHYEVRINGVLQNPVNFILPDWVP